MATLFQGTTQQQGTGHSNIVVAIKVDPLANPKTEILDQVVANPDGSFLLEWSGWSGRVIIGALDTDDTLKLESVFYDFKAGVESADINITQAATYPIIGDVPADRGINITQAPIYTAIGNINQRGINITQAPIYTAIGNIDDRGINITQAPVYAIVKLDFNMTQSPPENQNATYDLNEEVN